MKFEVSDKGRVLARVEVKSNFVEQVKAKKFKDKRLNALQNKVVNGEVKDATLDVCEVLQFKERLCIPRVDNLIRDVVSDAYGLSYSIHLAITNIYYDLRKIYWWPRINRDIIDYVFNCQNCQQVMCQHQSPAGLLQCIPIPMWKWEHISMDFVVGLPKILKSMTPFG